MDGLMSTEIVISQSVASINPDLERALYKKTYFDRYELRLLFALVGSKETVSIDEIIALLRADNDINNMLKYIFSTFEYVNDGVMPVSEFIKTLSIISRGSKSQRLGLVFHIADQDNDGHVEKDEVMKLANLSDTLLRKYQFGYSNIASPEEAVYDMFGFEEDKKQKVLLSKKEFMQRAELDPDVYRCFGLFDYLYYMLIKPIEEQLRQGIEDKPHIRGRLVRQKQILFGLAKWRVDSWCEVRDGFLITYKKETLVPKRVVCLQDSTITIMDNQYDSIVAKSTSPLSASTRYRIRHEPSVTDLGSENSGTSFVVETPRAVHNYVASSEHKAVDWVSALRANTRGGYQFQSFAPPRTGISAKWYTSAKQYFSDIADAIQNARREIFITDWWLVPKIYMKRDSDPLDKNFRLDTLLYRAAQSGVKVSVLIWDESNLGVNLNSRWTKRTLESLHRNIRVIRHPRFVLTWSHHQKTCIIDQNLAFLGGIDLCHGRYDDDNYMLMDEEAKIFPGMDYRNACMGPSDKPSLTSGKMTKTKIDRGTIVRMPWHDTAIRVDGRAARDVAFNFIQRWNFAKESNRNSLLRYQYLAPSTEDLVDSHGQCECQILRSVSEWSAGQPVEDSIYKAHINLINTSQHFIYIQNQYFISSTTTKRPKNKIALAIQRRIKRAIEANETFRVIVLLPIHNEGFLQEKPTKVLVEWNLRTVHAIVHDLEQEFPDKVIWNYIAFNSLRNWVVNATRAFTEQIYVHSKLLIVDDLWAIIGSANINDRSMRGTRDSEIACVIRDTETVDITMNGAPFQASKFVHTMRMALWRVHLGISDDEEMCEVIIDPVSDSAYHGIWRSIARQNTTIYVNVFGPAIPESCAKVEEHEKTREIPKYLAEPLNRVKGFLVEYPFRLLADQAQAPANPPKWFSKIFL